MQTKIYSRMKEQGFCVSNVLFGVGSWAFLQDSSRDSYSFAIKGSNSIVNGEELSMQKTPKTAASSKTSLKLLHAVYYVSRKKAITLFFMTNKLKRWKKWGN
jgi:hypothetical protein